MALLSPGVEVTIIDQSQYLPGAPASVPLIILATAQNKPNAAGTGIAPATTAANANKLYAVSSQRDLVSLFGTPFFYKTTNGTPIQGYELNEYGLLAAYSVLGVSNLCYVIRANIDLAGLIGSTGRPSAAPANGTYWLDTTQSTWGIFQFNANTGNFEYQVPIVIEDPADTVGSNGQPQSYIGNVGSYAVTMTIDYGAPTSYSTYWFKTPSGWVATDSVDWQRYWPAVTGTTTPVTISAGNLVLSGFTNGVPSGVLTTVAVPVAPNNTVTGLVSAINAANIPGIVASNSNGRLNLFETLVGGTNTGVIVEASSTAGVLADIGIVADTYYGPAVVYGTNAQQPLWKSTDTYPHPTGSVWIKTNSPNFGTNLVISEYSAATGTYVSRNCPVSVSDWVLNNSIDSSGGKNIPAGSVYAQVDFDQTRGASPMQLFRRSSSGASTFVGTVTNPTFANNASFFVRVSQPNSSSLSSLYQVTMPSTGTLGATEFVTAWSQSQIPFTTATISATGAIVLTHTEGGVILLDDVGVTSPASAVTAAGFIINTDPTAPTGTVGAKWGPFKPITYTNLPTVGGTGTGLTVNVQTSGYIPTFTVNIAGTGYVVGDIVTVTGGGPLSSPYAIKVTTIGGTGNVTGVQWLEYYSTPQYVVQLSNWQIFNYVANDIAPVAAPTNDTNWFYSVVDQVDIMTNVGGVWTGYRNISYASDGLPQAVGTPATDPNGPIIAASAPSTQSDGSSLEYGDLWIDTSDLENYPVIYRWQNFNSEDQWVLLDNTDQTTPNGIIFQDARWAPNGTTNAIDDAIPSITSLLVSNYLDLDAPEGALYPQGTLLFNTRRSGYNVKQYRVNYFNANSFPDQTLPQEKSTWVTVSGNQTNGAPYMGRKAQRNMVVQALKSTVDTSNQIRDEETFVNLLACPNYCELQPNMVALNNERGQTSYIIGDTPLRLAPTAQSILAWATNVAGATSTSEDGLVTRNTYLGLYYPSGITNDLTGAQVVIPPSHMILRTMLYNDSVAYPWFAPAGQRRGIIDNATNIGYIDAATGEFVVDKNRVGLRDVEYSNFINPITSFTNVGLLNYGNKNSFDSQSALDRTNVARLIAYLRERLARAVTPFLFEPNDNLTRTQVRALCQTLLADIQAKRGVYDYLVVCDESNNTPARIDRNELWIDIAIEPVKAVEFIYIPIRILNTGELAGLATNG
jgi:hypothetical protein